MADVIEATAEATVREQFDIWERALRTGNPETVAELYAADAVLVPTVSNVVRHDRSGIIDYFTRFLAKAPQARLHESHLRLLGDIAIHSGIYLFRLTREAGSAEVPARFTFVYRKTATGWKIIEHHSSYMPERGAY